MSDDIEDILGSIGGRWPGPPANHHPQTDVPRASVPSPKTKDNRTSLLNHNSTAGLSSAQAPLGPTNMQGTFLGALNHGGSGPGSSNFEVPQSNPMLGQSSHGAFPATNLPDTRDGRTLSTHNPGSGPRPQGFSRQGRGPPPQLHGQVGSSRPLSALRRIRGGQDSRHPTHPANVPFMKAKGHGGGTSKGGYPLPGNKAFGALPKGAGVKMPEGMSERTVQKWKRLHSLHQHGHHSLGKEEQDAKTGANVAAVEVQTARKELERKNAVLNTKGDFSKILSNCATLLDVDVIGELRARVDTTEHSAPWSIAPSAEGLDSFAEEPMGGEADEFYEGGDEDGHFYTTEGYPYYCDDSGIAQWYDPEAAEYRSEEIKERGTQVEHQQHYAGAIKQEEML